MGSVCCKEADVEGSATDKGSATTPTKPQDVIIESTPKVNTSPSTSPRSPAAEECRAAASGIAPEALDRRFESADDIQQNSTPNDELYSYSVQELIEKLKADGVQGAVELGTNKNVLVAALKEQLDKPKVILVIGECGDGKSTLVNALRDETLDVQECKSGLATGGVTKQITTYIGHRIKGRAIKILDTPGIGDKKIKPPALMTMIQEVLTQGKDKIHGVVVTAPIANGRVKMGGQVVQKLVEQAFFAETGTDKWASIILCGTQLDVAKMKPATIENFSLPVHDEDGNENTDEDGNYLGVVADFFKDAADGWGKFALTDQADYSQLIDMISKLPSEPIDYKELNAKEMSDVLSSVTGDDPEELRKQFADQLEARIVERERAMQAAHDRQREEDAEKQRVELERVQQEHTQEAERLKHEMDDKMNALSSGAAEERAQLTHETEAKLAALAESQQKEAEEFARKNKEQQDAIELRMQEERDKTSAALTKLQHEKEEAEEVIREEKAAAEQCARDVLVDAIGQRSRDAILAALTSMTTLGLKNDPGVEKAKDVLAKLEQEQRDLEQKRVDDAVKKAVEEKEREEKERRLEKCKTDLIKATKNRDEGKINRALSDAKELGLLQDDPFDDARKVLDELAKERKAKKAKAKLEQAATGALDTALDARDADAITAAVETMKKLGLTSGERIACAHETLQALKKEKEEVEAKAQREEAARDAMREAIEERDEDMLDEATEQMRLLGLADDPLVKRGMKVKAELQAEIRRKLEEERRLLDEQRQREREEAEAAERRRRQEAADAERRRQQEAADAERRRQEEERRRQEEERRRQEEERRRPPPRRRHNGPRCKDGSLDMRYAVNRGYDKWHD